MKSKNNLQELSLAELIDKYPYIESFLVEQKFPLVRKDLTILEIYHQLSEGEKEDIVIEGEEFLSRVSAYIENMQDFLGEKETGVELLSLLAGNDKDGNQEQYERIDIKTGEIVALLGPTGSGKSRLLADIEWAAQGDSPTGRTILINGEKAAKEWRMNGSKKLVAQLSQNMNFVMDLSVEEFLCLHAESRLLENEHELVKKVIQKANDLAGETFSATSQITSLSGGQSRALMIADTAILSSSPIILIDEIENAGIDREKALDLLVGEEKIVLMATHDPTLALMADKRIVINNGAIVDFIERNNREKDILRDLKAVNDKLAKLRKELRYGKRPSLFD
ncbi:ATP-binding cassette domain-containing protein [Iocasia frigidifontis]|uniref:ATP-binding cassette domain-containing protein n=1 Tax=Iocasia fonsfrigidae TaxID=2682810 RepID=A0A8A7K5K8_9FIRM|nr:ATP-binding cassette domain-containing protein [Iocasia fonsfrigidae]QTL96601.1 ATP-binding cassette domain-containing protein [Iocasia fonsfrigidae]